MNYLAVKDLKKTKELWAQLAREKELMVTREGKPCAILVEVTPETAEESLAEIRRALFSAAITRTRRKAAGDPPKPVEIEQAIQASRKSRRKK